MRSRKRAARDAYFGPLGYFKICALLEEVTGSPLHQQQMVEKIGAKTKLTLQIRASGYYHSQPEFSYRRTAETFKICCEGYLCNNLCMCENQKMTSYSGTTLQEKRTLCSETFQ